MKKYLQIYDRIKKEITDGVRREGDKLPSKRTAADTYGVSVISVEHAYSLLEAEGYVEARERSGFFVSFRSGDVFAADAEKLPMRTQASVSAVYEGISFDLYAKTARAVLAEYGEELLGKPENKGLRELREAIRDYLRVSRGIDVEAERIIIGAGAEYLYGLAAELMEGREYGIESPSYHQIEHVYRARGVKYELLPIGQNGIVSEALRTTGAQVLHITPYRSFPTGVCADASKKAEYLAWATARGGFLIEDDYESEFSLSGSITETLIGADREDRVIYVNTFSRTVTPGIRAGYMILPRRLLPLYDEKLGAYSCPVPTFEQYLLAHLLRSGDFVRHVNRVRRRRRGKSS